MWVVTGNHWELAMVTTMKRLLLPVLLFALSVALPMSNAEAYCNEPSMFETEPSAPSSYSKPSAPYCLSGYSYTRKHTCDQWEIDSYIDEVNDYIRKLNDYTAEAQAFASSAIAFANEAADYAECEADEVKSEFE